MSADIIYCSALEPSVLTYLSVVFIFFSGDSGTLSFTSTFDLVMAIEPRFGRLLVIVDEEGCLVIAIGFEFAVWLDKIWV